MNELLQAINEGNVLKMEKVKGEKDGESIGYIVLRQWTRYDWVCHYYNASEGAFKFAVYSTNYQEALDKYNARVKRYNKPKSKQA